MDRLIVRGALSAWLLIGCGGDDRPIGGSGQPPPGWQASADGGAGDAGGPYTTPFPPRMPQVMPGSGAVLASPRVVPVFFPKDTLQAAALSFMQALVGSSATWRTLQEYGVGSGSVNATLVLAQAPAAQIQDSDLRALLQARISDGTLPAPDQRTIYLFMMPDGVTVTLDGAVSCTDFAGYHQAATLASGARVAYAVVPRCSRTSVPALTAAVSHELAEAASDPLLTTNNELAEPYTLWQVPLNGSEVGDLCENLSDPFYNEPGVGVVSRLWSNAAAAALRNPCQPAPVGTAFFSVPIHTELRPVVLNGVRRNLESIPVAVGQTATVAVRLLAGGAPSPVWTVSAQEIPLPGNGGGAGTPALSLSWQEARPQGPGGTVLHLLVKANAAAAQGYTTVLITSSGPTQSGAQTQTQWAATVRVTP